MKHKLLIAICFLLISREYSFSQEYIPMLNNSTWNLVSANFMGNQNLLLTPGPDVVIGGYTYKKYTDPTIYNTDNYVREDIVNRKVYRNVNGVDELLYDFSLQVLDNIVLGDGKTYKVTSITNVNVNGGQRKMLYLVHFIGSFASNSEVWIEGVGSNRHPLKPEYEMYLSDPYIYLSCSAQNGMGIYNHGIANGQPTPTDCSMLLSLDDTLIASQKITMAPNPFTNEFTISTTSNFDNATLKIYNSMGQLVRKIENLNGQTITVSRENLMIGIYFVDVTTSGKSIAKNKIIVSD